MIPYTPSGACHEMSRWHTFGQDGKGEPVSIWLDILPDRGAAEIRVGPDMSEGGKCPVVARLRYRQALALLEALQQAEPLFRTILARVEEGEKEREAERIARRDARRAEKEARSKP